MRNDYEIPSDAICIVTYVNPCSDTEGYYNINNNRTYTGNKLGKNRNCLWRIELAHIHIQTMYMRKKKKKRTCILLTNRPSLECRFFLGYIRVAN